MQASRPSPERSWSLILSATKLNLDARFVDQPVACWRRSDSHAKAPQHVFTQLQVAAG